MRSGDRHKAKVYAGRILRGISTYLVRQKASIKTGHVLTTILLQEWYGPTLTSIPMLTTRCIAS